jgi:hypothetical protein
MVQKPVQTRVESDREKWCREFVQRFYDWYLRPGKRDREHPDGELGMDDAIRMQRSAMSGELYSSLKADRDAQAQARELVGLDFDPFTFSQDNSPKFEAKSTVVHGDDCRAGVWGIETGVHRETVEPEAKEEEGAWKFVNFHYRYEFQDRSPPRESDLIEILKENASDRKREVVESLKNKGS